MAAIGGYFTFGGESLFNTHNTYQGGELMTSTRHCLRSLSLTCKHDYRSHVGHGCPDAEVLEGSYERFYLKSFGKPYDKKLDPYYMDAWPAFNSGNIKFEGSPEFNGMKTITNVVTNANDKAGAPTNGYEELGKMDVPANKADRDLDMMFNLLDNLWLAPKQKQHWIDSGGNKIHIGDNISDANIDSFSVNKGVDLSFGLIIL